MISDSKNRPNGRNLLWCDFTKPLEPILARSAEAPPPVPAKLERAPPEKPFAFLRFPPAEFLFLVEKGVSGGSPAIHGRGGAAPVGTADALRARNPKAKSQNQNQILRVSLFQTFL